MKQNMDWKSKDSTVLSQDTLLRLRSTLRAAIGESLRSNIATNQSPKQQMERCALSPMDTSKESTDDSEMKSIQRVCDQQQEHRRLLIESMETMNAEHDEIRLQLVKVRKQHAKAVLLKNEMQRENGNLLVRIAKYEKQMEEMEQQYAQCQEAMCRFNSFKAQLTETGGALKSTIEQMTTKMKAKEMECDTLKVENKTLKARKMEMETELNQQLQQNVQRETEFIQDLAEAKHTIEELQSHIQELTKVRDVQREELISQDNRIEKQTNVIDEWIKDYKPIELPIQKELQPLSTIHESHDEKLTITLTKSNQDLIAALMEAEHQLEAHHQQKSSLQSYCGDAAESESIDMNPPQVSPTAPQMMSNEFNSSFDEMKISGECPSEQHDLLLLTLHTLNAENEEMRDELEVLRTTEPTDVLLQRNDERQHKVARLEQMVATKQRALNDIVGKCQALRDIVKMKNEIHEQYQEKIAEIEAMRSAESAEYHKHIEKMKIQLAERDRKMIIFKTERLESEDALKITIDRINQTMLQKEGELDALRGELEQSSKEEYVEEIGSSTDDTVATERNLLVKGEKSESDSQMVDAEIELCSDSGPDLKQFEEQICALKKQIVDERQQQHQDAIRSLEGEIQSQQGEFRRRNCALRVEMSNLQERYEQSESQKEVLEAHVSTIQATVDEVQTKNKALSERLETMTSERSSLLKDLEQLKLVDHEREDAIKSVVHTLNAFRAQSARQCNENELLQLELATMKAGRAQQNKKEMQHRNQAVLISECAEKVNDMIHRLVIRRKEQTLMFQQQIEAVERAINKSRDVIIVEHTRKEKKLIRNIESEKQAQSVVAEDNLRRQMYEMKQQFASNLEKLQVKMDGLRKEMDINQLICSDAGLQGELDELLWRLDRKMKDNRERELILMHDVSQSKKEVMGMRWSQNLLAKQETTIQMQFKSAREQLRIKTEALAVMETQCNKMAGHARVLTLKFQQLSREREKMLEKKAEYKDAGVNTEKQQEQDTEQAVVPRDPRAQNDDRPKSPQKSGIQLLSDITQHDNNQMRNEMAESDSIIEHLFQMHQQKLEETVMKCKKKCVSLHAALTGQLRMERAKIQGECADRLRAVQSSLNGTNQRLFAALYEKQQMTESVRQMEIETAAHQSDQSMMEIAERNLAKCRQIILDLQREKDDAFKQLDQARADGLREELGLKRHVVSLNTAMRGKTREITKLQDKISSQMKDHTATISTLKGKYNAAQQEVKTMGDAITQLTDEKAILVQDLLRLHKVIVPQNMMEEPMGKQLIVMQEEVKSRQKVKDEVELKLMELKKQQEERAVDIEREVKRMTIILEDGLTALRDICTRKHKIMVNSLQAVESLGQRSKGNLKTIKHVKKAMERRIVKGFGMKIQHHEHQQSIDSIPESYDTSLDELSVTDDVSVTHQDHNQNLEKLQDELLLALEGLAESVKKVKKHKIRDHKSKRSRASNAVRA